MRRLLSIFLILMSFFIFFTACQPTPEETIVAQKDGSALEEKINESADASKQATGVGSHYVYQKSYEQPKNTLTVDAILTGGAENAMPVFIVEDAPFESGEPERKIVEGLFPGYTIYNQDELLKQEIKAEIDYLEMVYFRIQNNLDWETGEPIPEGVEPNYILPPPAKKYQNLTPEEEAQLTVEDKYEAYLEERYQDYANAPDVEDLEPADYKIEISDGNPIPQDILCAVQGEKIYKLTLANGTTERMGTIFWVERIDKALPDDIAMPEVLTPAEELRQDEAMQGDLAQIEECMANIGVDYLALYGAYQGNGICRYIYTRQYNTAQEDYVPSYLGMTATDGDGVIMRDLWGPEYMQITTYEGEIYDIDWYNASKIKEVENENVKLLPWEEIQEIFEQQIDFMLTPAMGHRKEEGQRIYFPNPTDITIDRIHLGLTKVLVQDTDEYRLIPTWSFFGTDNSPNDVVHYEKCYLTINAIDGSIIDRGVMY